MQPPDSFGSANNQQVQSYHYVPSKSSPPSPGAEETAPGLVPEGNITYSELKEQLKRVLESYEEMTRAVTELQLSVSSLEVSG